MKNINKRVEALISRDMSLRKNLKRGLINVRALARYLIDTYELKTSIDAVISAIRRYSEEEEFKLIETQVKRAFTSSVVSTRDSMCVVTIQVKALKNFLDELKTDDDAPRKYRIIKSKKFAKIFVNKDKVDDVVAMFNDEELVSVKENLGEVCIVLQQNGFEDIQGLLARLTGEIALNEISISECIVCFPEFLVYVDRTDLLDAHHTILGLQDGD